MEVVFDYIFECFLTVCLLGIFIYFIESPGLFEFIKSMFLLVAVGVFILLPFILFRGVESEIVQAELIEEIALSKPRYSVDVVIKANGFGGKMYTLICYDGKTFKNTFEIDDDETKVFRVGLWDVKTIDKNILKKTSNIHISVNNIRQRRNLRIGLNEKLCGSHNISWGAIKNAGVFKP